MLPMEVPSLTGTGSFFLSLWLGFGETKNLTCMRNLIFIICLFTIMPGFFACESKPHKNKIPAKLNTKEMPVTADTLKQVLEAFNRHDLDAIMAFFADDCRLNMPRGPEPGGKSYVGKDQVREALASRLTGIPDVHYAEDRHWVAGDRGVSEWLLTGTTTAGIRLKVRGCDLWEFKDGKIVRKDSYWKIVE
jgi:ketosteroid isomerase-like protein